MHPKAALPAHLRLRDERGQAIVEFALVLPMLLLLIFGVFDLSRGFGYWNDVNQIAAERARAFVVNRSPDPIAGGAFTDGDLTVNVTFCRPEGNGAPGDPVTARTTASYDRVGFVRAALALSETGTINGSATMRLEREALGLPAC